MPRLTPASLLSLSILAALVMIAGAPLSHAAPVERGGVEPLVAFIDQVGTTGTDRVIGVAVDAGTVFVVGETDGTLPGQTPAGGRDGFVSAYDLSGSMLWRRQFGTSESDDIAGVAVLGDTVYVAGDTVGEFDIGAGLGIVDAFVAAFDRSGTPQWVRQVGTADLDTASGISAEAGRVYLSGDTGGTFPGQSALGGGDGFVVAFDPAGTQQWVRQVGTSDFDRTEGVATGDGVYLAGETFGAFSGEVDLGGGDGFLLRLDPSGQQSWVEQFGTDGEDDVGGVAADPSAVHVSGSTSGGFPGQRDRSGFDAFVASFDPAGSPRWAAQFGTSGEDDALAVGVGEDSSVLVGGSVLEALPGQPALGGGDGFVASLSDTGRVLWAQPVGSDHEDQTLAVAFGSGLSVAVGETGGTLGGQQAGGQADGFVVGIDGPPVMRCRGEMANVVGTVGDDDLSGTAGDDVIVALGGNDKIAGRDGHDRICTGRGNELALGGKGRDTIYGDRGDDKLRGGEGADWMAGGKGIDVVVGNGGRDRVSGSDDADRVNGGFGPDEVFGDAGNDRLVGSSDDDLLDGGLDDDQLLAGKGDDRLRGRQGSDILLGKDGDDDLDGGSGPDRCNGGAGVNTLTSCERVG